MKKNKLIITGISLLLALIVSVSGDVVKIKDDSSLVGKITKIEDGKIFLETAYAGILEIDKTQVEGFETDQPVFVRLASGNTMSGAVKLNDSGEIEIENEDGRLITKTSKVKSSWLPGEKDPEILKLEAEIKAKERKWKYVAGVDVGGKSGNTSQKSVGMNLKAELKSPDDHLKFYLKSLRAEKEGDKVDDETIGGISYTSYFYDKLGWFLRSELEADEFEGISFRSTTAGGLSYRFLKRDDHKLEGRSGIGYLYEDYVDNTEKKSPSLDFGLDHFYKFKNDWSVNTELSLIPSIENTGDYLFFQDTGFMVPLGDSEFWKLQLGLANAYNSAPAKTKKNLDTTYYSRFVLEFE